MSRILISNNVTFHYDVIESAIVKYNEILKIEKSDQDIIDLFMIPDSTHITPNLNYIQLKEYLLNKYNINLIKDVDYSIYDYEIHCTAAASEAPDTDGGIRPKHMTDNKRCAYIAHDVTEELLGFSNVYFLSGFGRSDIPLDRIFIVDKFPEFEYSKNKIPEILIQGSFVRSKFDRTRDYSILEDILSIEYDLDFKITIIGGWHEKNFNPWDFIDKNKIHKKNIDKINFILNADWKTFNRICSKCDYIAPIVSKDNQPHCFNNKITSSIFYGRGYKKPMFVDYDFVSAYRLLPNEYIVYNREYISKDFNNLLIKHYGGINV